jgi:glycosyltransferase involved in cell wall biosynthesis
MRAALIERGIEPGKIAVIPNAVDPTKFAEIGPAPAVRERFCRPDQLLVGYVSNVSRREGHDVLVRAVAKARATGLDLACLIVGDGREREGLEQLARELDVAGVVHFTGNVDHAEINDYYRAMDLFVVPRRSDYAADYVTPLKPFEAMALGIPMIVSDRPALQEIVGADRGVTFRSEDPDDLAARIGELARDRERRRVMAEEARRWVLAERTWTANADRYVELYRDVREASRRRPPR